MTQIESFVNAGDSLRPLEMVTRVTPVTCFEAAFHATVATMLVTQVVDWWRQGHQHQAGGHFDGSSDPVLAAVPSGMSGDGLVELLVQRF